MEAKERDLASLLELLGAKVLPVPADWPVTNRQLAMALLARDFLNKSLDWIGRDQGEAALWLRPVVPGAERSAADGDARGAVLRSVPSRVDVLIICPLSKELVPALLAIFDHVPAREAQNIDGHKVYFTTIKQSDNREIRVAVSVANRPRNAPMALVTEKLVRAYRPEAALLAGIGAGVIGRAQIGDVIVSDTVIDVAGGRAEPEGVVPRDRRLTVPFPIFRQLEGFPLSIKSKAWRRAILKGANRIRKEQDREMPLAGQISAARWAVSNGTIVAGEHLVADGSLPKLLERDDAIRSCDMEGSGFAQACEEKGIQWGIFRCVTDLGNPDKSDAWQAIGAFAAAYAAREFVKGEFRLKKEVLSGVNIP